jgi:hypothetical protein
MLFKTSVPVPKSTKCWFPLIKILFKKNWGPPKTQHWSLVLHQLVLVKESIDIEYRVSDYKFEKSIEVSISNTCIEVSEYRISNTEKSIECPALHKVHYSTGVQFKHLGKSLNSAVFWSRSRKKTHHFGRAGVANWCGSGSETDFNKGGL